MTVLSFFNAMSNQEYRDTPMRAEELYKYAHNAINEALEGRKINGLSTEEFASILINYWTNHGLTVEQCYKMVTYCSTQFINSNLRPEFDEEYAELFWS